MADLVLGTVLLDDRHEPHALFLACVPDPVQHQNRPVGCPPTPFMTRIPAQRTGTPGNGWSYTERGDMLDVNPSVLCSTTWGEAQTPVELFHNSQFWSVKFVRRPADVQDLYNYFHHVLNPDIFGPGEKPMD